MSKADDEKAKKQRAKEEKETAGMDIGAWFAARLEKDLKERAKTHKVFNHPIHTYTTGLVVLDHYINPTNPGILGGNIVQFAGHGGSGKTTTALNIAKYHKAQGYHTIYCDPEGGLEDTMCEAFGFSKYTDPLFHYYPAHMKAEQHFSVIKDTLMRHQGEAEPCLIIVDSVTYLRPEVETFDKVRVGDNIPFFNNFLRAIRPLVGNTNCLLILLNGVYQDNENQHNDYKISGGETLKRACDLITVHYKRTNPANPTADQAHSHDINAKVSISYRQKLGIKIVKNKWTQSDAKLASLDYFFANDLRFGPFQLDNTNSMLQFLKQMDYLKSGGAYYTLGDTKMTWKEWEIQANTNLDVRRQVITQTLAALKELFINPIGD